jgi:hypothetical protein
VWRGIGHVAEYSLNGTAKAESGTEERVEGLALCARVKTFAVLLLSPCDGYKLDSVEQVFVVVWNDARSIVSEDQVPEFDCLGFTGVFGSNDLAWASGKEIAGDKEINCVIDSAGFWWACGSKPV